MPHPILSSPGFNRHLSKPTKKQYKLVIITPVEISNLCDATRTDPVIIPLLSLSRTQDIPKNKEKEEKRSLPNSPNEIGFSKGNFVSSPALQQ
jgi:hypothetical protein